MRVMRAVVEVTPEYVLPNPNDGSYDLGQLGGDIVIVVGRRWIRLAAYAGTPPGGHMGWWRTDGGYPGSLRGVNYRCGRAYRGPCLTLFVHTRRRDERPVLS